MDIVGVPRVGRPTEPLAFSVYGFLRSGARDDRLGYNGQRLDGLTQGYFLGNGRRLYSPVLMRFCSPDVYSPFDKGGLNAYAYCAGDPVNFNDANGTHGMRNQLSPSLIKYSPALEKIYLNIDNTDFRIHYFTWDAKRPKGQRIQEFWSKTLNQEFQVRPISRGISGEFFFVNEERTLFVNAFMKRANGGLNKALPYEQELTDMGFTKHYINSPYMYDDGWQAADVIRVFDDHMYDFSTGTLYDAEPPPLPDVDAHFASTDMFRIRKDK